VAGWEFLGYGLEGISNVPYVNRLWEELRGLTTEDLIEV
jgi:hypothetical protein